MSDKPDITIIGPGRVGEALARSAHRVGYRIAAVAGGSHPRRSESVARACGGAKVLPLAEAAAAGGVVLLTVKDEAIQPVCKQLAAAGALAHQPVVAHCSGALNSTILAAASKAGCAVGTMHPLQTFPSAEAAIGRLPGTHFFIEGDPPAVEVLSRLARDLGGQGVVIDPQAKALYHAAAVMSANYLTALLDASLELYEGTGLGRDEARRAMAPLVRATLENVLAQGPEKALTGPIARGDVDTVRRHLRAMRDREELWRLYCVVGLRALEVARRSEQIDAETAEAIGKLLLGGE